MLAVASFTWYSAGERKRDLAMGTLVPGALRFFWSRGLESIRPLQIGPFVYLNVAPNSNPSEIKRFVSGISISFKCECHIIMQIQYTKNLNPGRSELSTTLS